MSHHLLVGFQPPDEIAVQLKLRVVHVLVLAAGLGLLYLSFQVLPVPGAREFEMWFCVVVCVFLTSVLMLEYAQSLLTRFSGPMFVPRHGGLLVDLLVLLLLPKRLRVVDEPTVAVNAQG